MTALRPAPTLETICPKCGKTHITRKGHPACQGHARGGRPCVNPPMHGGRVCRMHGGATANAKAGAARRLAAEAAAASLAEVGVHCIYNPLEELALVAEEARAFQQHCANMVARYGQEWELHGEHADTIRPIVAVYERALDRCGRLLADWVKLGFDERMVGLHERQAELVAQVLRAVLNDPVLALTEHQRGVAPDVLRRHLEPVIAA